MNPNHKLQLKTSAVTSLTPCLLVYQTLYLVCNSTYYIDLGPARISILNPRVCLRLNTMHHQVAHRLKYWGNSKQRLQLYPPKKERSDVYTKKDHKHPNFRCSDYNTKTRIQTASSRKQYPHCNNYWEK